MFCRVFIQSTQEEGKEITHRKDKYDTVVLRVDVRLDGAVTEQEVVLGGTCQEEVIPVFRLDEHVPWAEA